jgi:serpin B
VGSLNELTSLILTNAVYFDAGWEKKFDLADTQTAAFHLATGGRVDVPMMHRTITAAAVEEDRFAMVQLPYEGGRASMQIYLPREACDIPWLEQTFLTRGPDHWQREMSPHSVTLSLPRFRLKATLALGKILRDMGMPDAFSSASADFSGLASPTDGPSGPAFFLSEVIHKTFVDVDEKGTRAAAATASTLTTGLAASPPPLVLNVDHPFLFTICVNSPLYRAPAMLFVGRVMDPTA